MLINKTHYTFLGSCTKSLTTPEKILEKKPRAFAVTDEDTVCGCPAFHKELKGSGIKPILGVELSLESPVVLLAKDRVGWQELMRLVTKKSFGTLSKEDIVGGAASEHCVVLTDDTASYPVKHVFDVATFPCAPSYYVNESDYHDHRLMLTLGQGCTIKTQNKISDGAVLPFFQSEDFFFRENFHPTTERVIDLIEEYDIGSPPSLPSFSDTPNEDLRQLCREGFVKYIRNMKKEEQPYVDRIKYELGVIEEAGLANYFLIMWDIVRFAKSNGWAMSPARGSAGGCLISYLTNITEIDPIKYGLYFERFYNAGRNSPGRVALPDIDLDFPVSKREQVISYIRQKYGEDHVAQVITIGRLKGKQAIREVMRANGVDRFEVDDISALIEGEAAIADELQEMEEESGESSIIRWSLEHHSDALSKWARIDKGEIVGDYAPYFKQAIRLENLKKAKGKHASAIVIGAHSLRDNLALTADKSSNDYLCDFEYTYLESMGYGKFDILGVSIQDKIMCVKEMLAEGLW